jgi:hypothetical protein
MEPIDQLGVLLLSGVTDGRISRGGDAMIV